MTIHNKPAVSDLNGRNEFEELQVESQRTKDGYSTGEVVYNAFAALQGIPLLGTTTLDDPEQVKTNFRSFASFLIGHKMKNGRHYAPDTQCQYLSNAKNALAKSTLVKGHKNANMFKKDHEEFEWFTDLLSGLKSRGRAEAIRRGEAVRQSTRAIRRKLLTRIAEHLLKKGTAASMEERAVLLTLYHAVGRGGEVSTTNFDLMQWDEDDEALWTIWNQVKTGRCGDISMHPDAENYKMCVLHALACYIITAGGKLKSTDLEAPDWLFPSFYDLAEGGASSKASRILKNLVGTVEGLEESHAGHGLRAGSCDDMATNHLLSIVSMIARGDWDWTGECQIFGYITNKMHVAFAGKTLAAWKDPRQKVSSPRLDAIIHPDAKAKVLRLAFHLFLFSPNCLGDRLVGFRDAMVAVLLMYFEDKCQDLGYNNIVVKVITNTANQCQIPLADIREWGKLIRQDFNLRNAHNQSETGTDTDRANAAIITLSEAILTHKQEQAQRDAARDARDAIRDAEVLGLRNQLSRVENIAEELLRVTRELQQRSPAASPRKRKSDAVDNVVASMCPTLQEKLPAFTKNVVVPAAPSSSVLLRHRKLPEFDKFLDTELSQLIMTVAVYGIDWKAGCFGASVNSSQKTRGKKAYDAAIALATADESAVLKKRLKSSGEDGYEEWIASVKVAAGAITGRLATWLKQECIVQGVKDTLKGPTITISNVTNLLANFTKATAAAT